MANFNWNLGFLVEIGKHFVYQFWYAPLDRLTSWVWTAFILLHFQWREILRFSKLSSVALSFLEVMFNNLNNIPNLKFSQYNIEKPLISYEIPTRISQFQMNISACLILTIQPRKVYFLAISPHIINSWNLNRF